MATRRQDLFATRGDPWKPKPVIVSPSVAAFSHFWCTVRTRWATAADPDDLDESVLGQVTLVGNSSGSIVALDAERIQIAMLPSVTRLWTPSQVFYDVRGRLVADNHPYTLVRGVLTLGPTVGRAP